MEIRTANDTVPERLAMARGAGAVTLDSMKEDIYDRIQEMTHGRGADACIDAVGTEPATASGLDAMVDRIKVATFMGTDRPHVLRGHPLLPQSRHGIDRLFCIAKLVPEPHGTAAPRGIRPKKV